MRFLQKFCKTLFSGQSQHVLAKSHFWALKFSKSWNWPEILFKTGKQCAFHENCTKRSFQVMRSTFWPNRIFERQSSQNRETRPEILFKTEKQALFKNCIKRSFQSCAARFGQIASVKVVKIVTGLKFLQKRENSALFIKIVQNAVISGHAQHVLAKSHFGASKFSKSWNWPEILFKTGKQCAFHENCTKRSF